MENTISGIVKSIQPEITATPIALNDRIIGLYNTFSLSEEHYDTDDIATLVCEVLLTELDENMSLDLPEHTREMRGCRLIYDIFAVCKDHVRNQNLAAFAKKAYHAEATRSMDRLSYLTGLTAS